MKLLATISAGLMLLTAPALWSQEQPRPAPAPAVSGPVSDAVISDAVINDEHDHMLTPPPVSGQSYPTAPTAEERSNYLRGGLAFTTAYTDNAVGPVNGLPVSDVSYSVAPMAALDETTSRLHLVMTYAPGFTFYQRESSLNEEDQNASISFQYRLSRHVTISARDGFQKSSNVFNQPDLGSAVDVSGGAQEPNLSVIPPIADRLSNSGNVGIAYQFATNSMVGASGTFTNLHYPNQSEVPGLFDSESQGGVAFYSLRVAKRHYLGATYQYQRLLSFPEAGTNETQTHALLLFYTVYPTQRLSISFFGGPQRADASLQFPATACPNPPAPCATPGSQSWNPAA